MSNLALKSRATKATYTFHGSSLKLSARFEKLEKLRELGRDPFEFIGSALDLTNPDACADKLTTLFVCLQDEADEYSETDIRDAFFGNFAEFFTEDNVKAVAVVIGHLLGQDISAKLAELAVADDSPKKAD